MSEDAVLVSGPLDFNAYGKDAICWRWFIGGHEVLVEISGTAFEADREYLPPQVQEAIETKGESEIRKLIEWDAPPRTVRVTTGEVTYS